MYVLFGDCNASDEMGVESKYTKLKQILDEKQIPNHKLKNGFPLSISEHYVVVVELHTSNVHRNKICKSIIDSFRRIPCITYISFIRA